MTSLTWDEARGGYAEATSWFQEVVGQVAGDHWSDPALGEWSVRDLAGHTSRALITVEDYVGASSGDVEIETAAEYFVASLAAAGPEAVAERGRSAGSALGEDPFTTVSEIVARVLVKVRAAEGHDIAGSPFGRMRLVDYLPTRTFELTVHTGDIVQALALQGTAPLPAARQALAIAAELAVERGFAGDVLAAVTGRRSLPQAFTVL